MEAATNHKKIVVEDDRSVSQRCHDHKNKNTQLSNPLWATFEPHHDAQIEQSAYAGPCTVVSLILCNSIRLGCR